jgi:hypothetical protein
VNRAQAGIADRGLRRLDPAPSRPHPTSADLIIDAAPLRSSAFCGPDRIRGCEAASRSFARPTGGGRRIRCGGSGGGVYSAGWALVSA